MAELLFNRKHYTTAAPSSVQANITSNPQSWGICSTDPLVTTGDCLTFQVIGEIPQFFVGLVLDPDIDLPFAGVWTTTDALWSFGEASAPPNQRQYFEHPAATATDYDEATAVFKILRTDTGLEYYVDGVLVDTRAAGGVDLPGPPMPPLYPAFQGPYQVDPGPVITFSGLMPVTNCGSSAVASWPLPPLNWTAIATVTGPPVFEGTTQRFAAGNGSQWYLIPQLSDSGQELRSKTVKYPYVIGKLTNANIRGYRFDVGQPINVAAMENDERLAGASRALSLPDTSDNVEQSPMKPMSLKSAVMHTMRISGDDRGEEVRDRIDQVCYQQAVQGVRR